MTLQILAFGIAKDIFGAPSTNMDISKSFTVQALKTALEERYPKLRQLASYRIAVNEAFATEQTIIEEGDEVAVIPPVSGG